MVVRLFVVLFALLCALPAQAGTIAVIDFQRAVVETDEGKSAQTRIDTMYESRRGEIERMRSELEREAQEFQSQAMILADSARAEREQALIAKNQRFQQTAMQYETELQQTYGMLLQELDQKMRSLAITIAKEKGYDMVLDMGAVVYVGSGAVDMTDELVQKYNAIHKQ